MRLTFVKACPGTMSFSVFVSSSDRCSRESFVSRGVSPSPSNMSHSAIEDAAFLISSLPRPLCCRRNPIALLEPGPRDCRSGAEFSPPVLTVRLLPIGAVLW